MSGKTIAWAAPKYWGREEKYVLDAFSSSWISGGGYIERLERGLSDYCRSPYVVSVSSGTTALHLAYLALGIGLGDEIIVPGFGFMAAANVAIHVGARPVFSEVNRYSWCMGASEVEKCITSKTKAIVPIHTYGNVCDMDDIILLARERGIAVIEDAAEAFGSKYKGQMAGTIAEIGIFSFHATKTITTGEGGAVTCQFEEVAERLKLYRSHGMATKRYWHEVAGHNFRLPNMQAAIGCAQLEEIETIVTKRKRVYAEYKNHLSCFEGVRLQSFGSYVDPLIWAVAIEIDKKVFEQGRDALMSELMDAGIETRPGFYSANTMPHIYGEQFLPICSEISKGVISLPSSPTLNEEDVAYICNRIKALRK